MRRSKPAAHRAVRDKHATQIQKYREQNEQATDEEDKTVYYFSGSRFFVNGKVVNEDIIPPTVRDMMQLSDQIRTAMQDVHYVTSPLKEANHSTFQAFVTTVFNLEEINIAYMRIRQERRFADHILVAYHLKDANNGIKQGGSSDKEHFADQEVLRGIKKFRAINVAVFVAREYGGFPLGESRFEILREMTQQALSALQPATLEPTLLTQWEPKACQPNRGAPWEEVLDPPKEEANPWESTGTRQVVNSQHQIPMKQHKL